MAVNVVLMLLHILHNIPAPYISCISIFACQLSVETAIFVTSISPLSGNIESSVTVMVSSADLVDCIKNMQYRVEQWVSP